MQHPLLKRQNLVNNNLQRSNILLIRPRPLLARILWLLLLVALRHEILISLDHFRPEHLNKHARIRNRLVQLLVIRNERAPHLHAERLRRAVHEHVHERVVAERARISSLRKRLHVNIRVRVVRELQRVCVQVFREIGRRRRLKLLHLRVDPREPVLERLKLLVQVREHRRRERQKR